MNLNNIKLYNTYRFVCNVYDKTKEIIGAPFLIQENPLEIKMVKLDGTTVSLVEVKEISSVRLAPNVRQALKEYAMSYANLYKLEKQYKEQISAVKNTIATYKKTLKRVTGIMDTVDFSSALYIAIFNKLGIYFDVTSWYFPDNKKGSYVEISQTCNICRWATPEQYSFISRNYDGTLYINDEEPTCLKRFVNRNAPATITILNKISLKTEKSVKIGDKGTLYAETTYRIPVLYGRTQKSIDNIISKIG